MSEMKKMVFTWGDKSVSYDLTEEEMEAVKKIQEIAERAGRDEREFWDTFSKRINYIYNDAANKILSDIFSGDDDGRKTSKK